GAADFQRQGHRHVEDDVQVQVAGGQARVGLQRVELCGRGDRVGGAHAGISSETGWRGCLCAPGGWTSVIFTALRPLARPNWPVKTGMVYTHTGTSVGSSSGRTSPTFSRVSRRRSMFFSASTLETVTSASCS